MFSTLLLWAWLWPSLVGALRPTPTPEIKEESLKNAFEGSVMVKKLFREGRRLGHTVWMKRSPGKIKAKYFACGEVNKRYEEWKADRKIVMACSGAFTTNDFGRPLPVGLTVDNGLVVNKQTNEEMDGLVLVYGTGGVAVSDIEVGDLYLQSLNKTVDVREAWDKFELLKWAEKEEATIFQTQLLAFKDNLRLEVEKARKNLRERRLLVLARDAQKMLYHIIFDIEESVYLGDIARDVLQYLQGQKMTVTAILNLDTGWYNQINVYDEQKQSLLEHNPDKDPTNLLVYYYE